MRRYGPTKLCDGAEMAIFLRPVFAASRVQRISELHSKFALRPHHVRKYGKHPINLRPLRLGEEKRRRKKKQHKNITPASATQCGHNYQVRWVKFIPSHVTFFSKSNSEKALNPLIVDEVRDKTTLTPFYGSTCRLRTTNIRG